MIYYATSVTDADLLGILKLQNENLAGSLTAEEIKREGFVTVMHSWDEIKKMNAIEQHVIAKDGESLVAYLLAMTTLSRFDIAVLNPMFELFSNIPFEEKKLSDFRYIVVGQVCVAKNYRGKGVLDDCYNFYRKRFKNKYEIAITEIAVNNPRSLNAHKRIGFDEVYRYQAPDGIEWSIVVWDWRKNL